MAELLPELKIIKKQYGEDLMHLCRELFPTLLEQKGLLLGLLNRYFSNNSRTLAGDLKYNGQEEDFKNFIYSKVDVEKEQIEVIEVKNPYEILKEAGYDLYECHSEEEIQSFKKYYQPGEELCTFKGGRLGWCEVFWAVRKDVESIKRESFKNPEREDDYGTSVMSIQFSRGKTCTVSIKNRYNHTVNNPDATYGNDLERIAPGLTQSFSELLAQRELNFNPSNIERIYIPNYTVANDGKYYKYNMEVNGKYYCPGNIIIDKGNEIKLEPEKEVLIDYFILNKEKKTLRLYDPSIKDSFIDSFENVDSIEMKKNSDKERKTRIITIYTKDCDLPITIEIDKDNNIVGYTNNGLKEVGDDFLGHNLKLEQLNSSQLAIVGDDCLKDNIELKELNTPQLQKTGDNFAQKAGKLKELNTPQLQEVGDKFCRLNYMVGQLNLPQLIITGKEFFEFNKKIKAFNAPQLIELGDQSLEYNEELEKLNTPQLIKVGDNVLVHNKKLEELNMPNLKECGYGFFLSNNIIRRVNLTHLIKTKSGFLQCNSELTEVSWPNLIETGDRCLMHNKKIEKFYVPQLQERDEAFLLQGHPRREQLIANMRKEIEEEKDESIKPKEIAELDVNTGLTQTEVNIGKIILEKIRGLLKRIDKNQR